MIGIFYRVENKNGIGPYRANSDTSWAEQIHTNEEHPTPQGDRYVKGKKELDMTDRVCGFKSLNQLKKWFTDGELSNLSKQGFCIKSFKGKNATVFEYQVIFKKTKHKPIKCQVTFKKTKHKPIEYITSLYRSLTQCYKNVTMEKATMKYLLRFIKYLNLINHNILLTAPSEEVTIWKKGKKRQRY